MVSFMQAAARRVLNRWLRLAQLLGYDAVGAVVGRPLHRATVTRPLHDRYTAVGLLIRRGLLIRSSTQCSSNWKMTTT